MWRFESDERVTDLNKLVPSSIACTYHLTSHVVKRRSAASIGSFTACTGAVMVRLPGLLLRPWQDTHL